MTTTEIRPTTERQLERLRTMGFLLGQGYLLGRPLDAEAMLETAASATPILVSIDDLQWADGGTIGAFEGLALRLAGLPIAWLVAWRPAEIPPEVGEALGRLEAAGALRLALSPLDDDAVAQVVVQLCSASFACTTGAQIPIDGGSDRVI